MKRALSGIKPSGDPHVGNLLGMIRPALEFQKQYECFFFIADLHALTTFRDAKSIYENTLDVAATWLACGLDPQRNLIYRQSDIPLVTELSWYLSCATGVGLLEKAHAYKDAIAKGKEANHGLFAYPVLMAADIVMYDADVVPVGKDQKQHVEMARDMAGSLNALCGETVLKLPEPYIREEVMTIPGLDGRKMSKSYDNHIPVFADEASIKKRIMAIKTDSTPVEAPKSLNGNLLGEVFKYFASKEQYVDLEARLQRGGLGWGHAKQQLFETLMSSLKEERARYAEIRSNVPELEKTLLQGAKRAFEIALPVLNRVRKAMGINTYGYRLA